MNLLLQINQTLINYFSIFYETVQYLVFIFIMKTHPLIDLYNSDASGE